MIDDPSAKLQLSKLKGALFGLFIVLDMTMAPHVDSSERAILIYGFLGFWCLVFKSRNVLCDGPGSKKMYSGMVLDGSKMYSNGGPGVFCEYGPPPDPGPSPGTFPTQSRQLYVHSFLSSKQVLLIFQVFLLCF